jgi:phthalate 4,5-dioxygenase
VLYRRILVDAIRKSEAGETPLMVVDDAQASALTGPPAIDGIGPTARVDEYWRETDATRRNKAAWAGRAA